MTRDEVLDLLPLYAGGDLDEVTTAAVREALAADPSLEDEARAWAGLDEVLARSLAPEGLAPERSGLASERPDTPAAEADTPAAEADTPAAEPAAPPLVTVRRRCPFCHDALQATSIALCASCATPHHAACFAQNRGCSLLGCGGTRAVEADGPESVVCDGCERHTPAGAPFCAWCGARVEAGQAPLHARPVHAERGAWSPRRYAAAAALLLAASAGMGGLFGLQQHQVLDGLVRTSERFEAELADDLMPQVLQAVLTAQKTFRLEDLDANGVADFAADYAGLVAAVRPTRWPDFDLLRRDEVWSRHYTVEVKRSAAGDRFHAVAAPRARDRRLRTWFVSDEGHVTVVDHVDLIDPETCRMGPAPALLSEALTEEEMLRRRALEAANPPEAESVAAPPAQDPPSRVTPIEARVMAVKLDATPPLVLLSVGADDGVVPGLHFSIYRGVKFIATVVVERVQADSAGCRVLHTTRGERVQQGDEALHAAPTRPTGRPREAGEQDGADAGSSDEEAGR